VLLSSSASRVAAVGFCLTALAGCVVVPIPLGTTQTASPAVKTAASAGAPVAAGQAACARDEVRVASGDCRKRSLYQGGGGSSSGGASSGGSSGGTDSDPSWGG